jgi:hypothetical protein
MLFLSNEQDIAQFVSRVIAPTPHYHTRSNTDYDYYKSVQLELINKHDLYSVSFSLFCLR